MNATVITSTANLISYYFISCMSPVLYAPWPALMSFWFTLQYHSSCVRSSHYCMPVCVAYKVQRHRLFSWPACLAADAAVAVEYSPPLCG